MTRQKKIEFGIDSFGDIARDNNGNLLSGAASIRQVVKEAVMADKLGIDAIGLGEHHRFEYAISSPEMVLAGIAGKTKRIKLASAVTVLSSDDPVRVYQRFSTLDALSNGRAQVILGRGSFTESFPLFGYDLRDYEILFEEKIELFARILKETPVSWEGTTRPHLDEADIFPKTESGKLATLVGVGGSPQSVIRAAKYGFPLMLAVISGSPRRFKPYIELYHRALKSNGHAIQPAGIHSPGFIAETDREAKEIFWPLFKLHHERVGRTRGWPNITREQFEQEISQGSLYVGSPETVAQKMAATIRMLDIERFDIVYGFGPTMVGDRERMIELYGGEVIPRVRALLGEE